MLFRCSSYKMPKVKNYFLVNIYFYLSLFTGSAEGARGESSAGPILPGHITGQRPRAEQIRAYNMTDRQYIVVGGAHHKHITGLSLGLVSNAFCFRLALPYM